MPAINKILRNIPKLITEEHNLLLLKPTSMQEVENVVHQLKAGKAPGPDGFTSNFFHNFWDLIKVEVWQVVEESRTLRWMYPGMNSTFIALIPKAEESNTPDSNSPTYSHQQFVDDNILFGHPLVQEACILKSLLSNFSDASGALINRVKSQIFFFNTPAPTQKSIARILGFTIASLPSKYLRAPLIASALKHSSWKDLLENLEARLFLWTHRALNMASRLVLIKLVLHSMPLYLFSILAAPKWVLKEIKNLQCNFLWGSSGPNRKLALVKWDNLCLPKRVGGIGLRDRGHSNKAMGDKVWWRWLAIPNTSWASLWTANYGNNIPIEERI
eukprot:PITA_16954